MYNVRTCKILILASVVLTSFIHVYMYIRPYYVYMYMYMCCLVHSVVPTRDSLRVGHTVVVTHIYMHVHCG